MRVAQALSVERLSYAYPGNVNVLQDVSFHIAPRERVALLGPNGAGKSTLLWCLVGILRGEGRVIVGGTELAPGNEPEVRRQIGLAFSEPDDQLFMPTVIRDLAFGPRAAGSSLRDAVETAHAAAEQVDLDGGLLDRAPHELSSGERRRAALAAVLTLGPQVLALDEPSNSLDARGCAALARTLRKLPCAQLIATHDLDFAARICSRGLVLVEGRLAADENLPALLADRDRLTEYGLLAPEEAT
jgi:cobalt/nickel transport system ATP-binding protein